jgi:TPR repeat protein
VLLYGIGVNADPARAVALFTDAARRNFAPAERGIGNAYLGGLGVPYDLNAAEKWFRRSLAHGFADAQYSIDGLALTRATPLTGPQRALPKG